MRRLAILGIAAVAVGLVALFDRGVVLGVDLRVVDVVGVLAVVAGIRYALAARATDRRRADIEPPEPRHRSAVLGDEVETALRATGRDGVARRAELRRRLRGVAVDVLVAHGGYDRAAAEAAVDNGTWTDDPVAAGYLAEPASLPPRMRVRNLLRRRSTVWRCVERALTAVEEVRGR